MFEIPNVLYTVESANLKESVAKDLKRSKKELTVAELIEKDKDKAKGEDKNGSNPRSLGHNK